MAVRGVHSSHAAPQAALWLMRLQGLATTVDNPLESGPVWVNIGLSPSLFSTARASFMSADLWSRSCERLAAELPEQQFNTWIRPLSPPDVLDAPDGGGAALVVNLSVPNRFKLDWIRSQYAGRIESILVELSGQTVRLQLMLAPREAVRDFFRPAANASSNRNLSAPCRAAISGARESM